MIDASIGYEENAASFLNQRDRSAIGSKTVQLWADNLDNSVKVLEIGCGGGYPITRTLVDAGLHVSAIDGSPSLLREFKTRFPHIETKCERVQDSAFFGRTFGAVIAVGVLFLLPEDEQIHFLHNIANLLEQSGYFLFTAPTEIGQWKDLNTGLACLSLGSKRYTAELHALGFVSMNSITDSGGNHYYSCRIA